MRNTEFDFSKLSIAERIQLAEDLWDSIPPEGADIPLTEAQKAELERRIEDLERNPDAGDVTLHRPAGRRSGHRGGGDVVRIPLARVGGRLPSGRRCLPLGDSAKSRALPASLSASPQGSPPPFPLRCLLRFDSQRDPS